MRFKHLHVPETWEHYFTRYPEGFTIMESLISWVSQVDKMVDNVNDWNKYLDKFVLEFDKNLQEKVTNILKEWQESGFLEVIIDEALQTQMDTLKEWTISKVNNIEVNPMEFGAVGDGITDDTEIIQDIFNRYNRVVFTHPHKTKQLTIHSDTHIQGRGGSLQSYRGEGILLLIGDNITIDNLHLKGNWDDTYIIGEILIHAKGKDNGYQTPPTNIKGINIRNCRIEKSGYSGVRLEYVQDSHVENNHIQYMGYEGVGVMSGYNIMVQNNTILDMSPGAPVASQVNAYGIFFSNTNRQDLIRYPRSEKCTAQNNYIENSPWEGMDTHGGKDISFIDNTLVSVTSGIIAVSVDDEQNRPTRSAENIIVSGNKVLDSIFGFSMDAPAGLFHKNVTIEGNQFIRCGNPSSGGAMMVRKVHNLQVANNQIVECKYTGIRINGNVFNGVITSNSITDLHTDSVGASNYATCIWMDGDVFYGVISGNSVKTVNSDIATKVNQYGLRIPVGFRSIQLTGGTNEFSDCSEQAYFVGRDYTYLFTSPITQFGRYSFMPDIETNTHETEIELKVPYSSPTLYETFATVRVDRGEKLVLEVSASGVDKITIKIRTQDGTNFVATQDITISWQTVGI